MRRTILITTIAALSLAACGSSDGAGSETPDSVGEETAAQSDTDDSIPAADDTGDTDTGDADDVEATDDSVLDDAGTDTIADAPVETEPAAGADKPEVELPAELPTDLVRTVLTEGTGDGAEAGDTVIVDYVGVRSEDGEEFDNSYDRGEPFPVVLGSGGVIQGWDDGLVGSKAGERVQLDIPADLAYGDQERSEVIQPNTPLTFVIDVREVIEGVDPADIPTEPGIPLTDVGVTETEFVELESGDGDVLEPGATALVRYVLFRADNGAALDTSWGAPVPIPFDDELFPGLLTGMDGMQVGDQRAITIPPAEAFGETGNPQAGLPAETDIVFLIELVGLG